MKTVFNMDEFMCQTRISQDCNDFNDTEYVCISCDNQIFDEDSIIKSHCQHMFYESNSSSLRELSRLHQLNGEHLNELIKKRESTKVLKHILEMQIQEKMTIQIQIQDPSKLELLPQLLQQIQESDHQQVIQNYVEHNLVFHDDLIRFIRNQEEQTNVNIIMNNQWVDVKFWNQFCYKISQSKSIRTLEIEMNCSNIDNNLFITLIKSINYQNSIEELCISISRTSVDDQIFEIMDQLMQIGNLKSFQLDIRNTITTWTLLDQFWLKYQQLIQNSFNYFNIFHHQYSIAYDCFQRLESCGAESVKSIYIE